MKGMAKKGKQPKACPKMKGMAEIKGMAKKGKQPKAWPKMKGTAEIKGTVRATATGQDQNWDQGQGWGQDRN